MPNCSRPLLLPATLMSWNWTRQSLIPKGNESYLELKSVLTMTTNYASRFTLLFSVALETSRAGMVCECRNNRSIAVRVRRPSERGRRCADRRRLICKIDPFRSIPPSAQTTVFKRTVATLGRMMGRKDRIIGSLEGFQRGVHVQGHRARGGGLLRDKYWPPRNLLWIPSITLPRGLSVITVPCHLSNGPNNRRLRSDKVRPVY